MTPVMYILVVTIFGTVGAADQNDAYYPKDVPVQKRLRPQSFESVEAALQECRAKQGLYGKFKTVRKVACEIAPVTNLQFHPIEAFSNGAP